MKKSTALILVLSVLSFSRFAGAEEHARFTSGPAPASTVCETMLKAKTAQVRSAAHMNATDTLSVAQVYNIEHNVPVACWQGANAQRAQLIMNPPRPAPVAATNPSTPHPAASSAPAAATAPAATTAAPPAAAPAAATAGAAI
jgi:hypothetical protein